MNLKGHARLWFYVSEWAAVSGTEMIAGYILSNPLLLGTRLYREVSLTAPSR